MLFCFTVQRWLHWRKTKPFHAQLFQKLNVFSVSNNSVETYKPSDKTPNGLILCRRLVSLPSIFFPTAHLGSPLISHWGPSFQSLLQRLAVPSRAWRTVMAHSNRSYQGDLEAQARRWPQKHRGVPSLHHGRQYRKLGDRVHLHGEITEQKSLWFVFTNHKLLDWAFNQIRKFGMQFSFCFRKYKRENSYIRVIEINLVY